MFGVTECWFFPFWFVTLFALDVCCHFSRHSQLPIMGFSYYMELLSGGGKSFNPVKVQDDFVTLSRFDVLCDDFGKEVFGRPVLDPGQKGEIYETTIQEVLRKHLLDLRLGLSASVFGEG